MNIMVLTDEQKECINNCYSNLHPTLVEKALTGCDCCEQEDEVINLHNGYEYVNMGESGMWSKYPIGLTEWNEDWKDNIKYFEWGGIEGYTKPQVGVDKQFDFDYADYKWCDGSIRTMTKYCSNSEYGKNGFTDDLTVLLPEDDACVQNMGGNWRMPTVEEFKNLYDNCNSEWVTDYNGISGLKGRLFKLKTDESKQLFLPASAYCVNGSINEVGLYGNFWSSSLDVSTPCYGYLFGFDSRYFYIDYYYNGRFYGFPIFGIFDDFQ